MFQQAQNISVLKERRILNHVNKMKHYFKCIEPIGNYKILSKLLNTIYKTTIINPTFFL